MGDALPDLARIRADSELLRQLYARIGETHRERRKDPEAWNAAIQEFGRRYGNIAFPGGCDRYERFLRGEATPLDLEAVLRFIEADPRHFRSGYMKEAIWRRLGRMELDDATRDRLEQAVLHRLDGSHSRELKYLCLAMVRIGRPPFREAVWAKAEHDGDELAPASWLLAYFESPQAGHALHRRIRSGPRTRLRRPDVRFDR